MTTAEQEWCGFADRIGLNKPSVSDVQRLEMRRAFFAGQYAMFTFQMAELTTLPDTEAEQRLSERHRELETFFRANFQQRN